jgi:hypothetical protein
MTGTPINRIWGLAGLGFIQASKKEDEQPCTVRTFRDGGSIAQMRVKVDSWYFTLKFDPTLIGDKTTAMVAKGQVFFQGLLEFDEYTKKSYVQVTQLVYGVDARKARKEALSAK